MSTHSAHSLEMLQKAQSHWPHIRFSLDAPGAMAQPWSTPELWWEDGPTQHEVRSTLGIEAARRVLLLCRTTSFIAWTLTRLETLQDHQGPPPSTYEALRDLSYNYEPGDRRSIVEKHFYYLDETSLPDLLQLAGSALTLARAETAAGLGSGLCYGSWEDYDLWLEHGGWHLACTLNP